MRPSAPGSPRRRRVFFVVCSVLVFLAIYVSREVLFPFVLALLIAYVLSPLVEFGESLRVGRRNLPRWLSVLVIYVGLLGGLSSLVAVAIPRFAGEVSRLTQEAPRVLKIVRDQWVPEVERRLRAATAAYVEPGVDGLPTDELPEALATPGAEVESDDLATPPSTSTSIVVNPLPAGGYEIVLPREGIQIVEDGDQSFRITTTPPQASTIDITNAITTALSSMTENTERTATTVLATAQKIVTALTRGIFLFFITLMISAYLLITSDRIFAFLRSFYTPEKRGELDVLVQRLDRGLAGVVRGQLVICAVNGVLSGIGFYALGLRYWFFLTILAAVLSIIPIFGSILSSVPAVLIALSDGLVTALLVLGWILLIHQIEANVLNPKIMGDAARVHPVLVVFALLAGEHAAGFAGALLAVPVLSIVQTLFLYFREAALGLPRTSMIPPPPVEPQS